MKAAGTAKTRSLPVDDLRASLTFLAAASKLMARLGSLKSSRGRSEVVVPDSAKANQKVRSAKHQRRSKGAEPQQNTVELFRRQASQFAPLAPACKRAQDFLITTGSNNEVSSGRSASTTGRLGRNARRKVAKAKHWKVHTERQKQEQLERVQDPGTSKAGGPSAKVASDDDEDLFMEDLGPNNNAGHSEQAGNEADVEERQEVGEPDHPITELLSDCFDDGEGESKEVETTRREFTNLMAVLSRSAGTRALRLASQAPQALNTKEVKRHFCHQCGTSVAIQPPTQQETDDGAARLVLAGGNPNRTSHVTLSSGNTSSSCTMKKVAQCAHCLGSAGFKLGAQTGGFRSLQRKSSAPRKAKKPITVTVKEAELSSRVVGVKERERPPATNKDKATEEQPPTKKPRLETPSAKVGVAKKDDAKGQNNKASGGKDAKKNKPQGKPAPGGKKSGAGGSSSLDAMKLLGIL